MNSVIELLKQAQGKVFVDEDRNETAFKLLPPLNDDELRALQAKIPCQIPDEMREVFRFARGFEGVLDSIDFSGGTGEFGLEEVFTHGIEIAADGFGNSWVVDLSRESKVWGPIFYACHDAPVIVFQTHSLAHFVEEVLKFGNAPWKSEIDDVHERLSHRIWSENVGVLSHADCLASRDQDLNAFAGTLDDSWEFIDLRSPETGDGFSWGRYGAKTVNKRFGEKRIFAYQKKTLRRRFLDALR